MPGSPVGRATGAKSVYDRIRSQIIEGTLAPDERLTEPGLAHALQVSRTPVREALRLLMAEGLVREQLTGGVRVTPLRIEDLSRIYEVRERLEGLMARDASIRISAEGRAELEYLHTLMERTRESDPTVLDLGGQFHAKIAEYADNPWCAQLLRQIRGHVDRYRARSTSRPGRIDEAIAEHRAVLEAVQTGTPHEAEEAMRHHVRLSAESAAQALRPGDFPKSVSGAAR